MDQHPRGIRPMMTLSSEELRAQRQARDAMWRRENEEFLRAQMWHDIIGGFVRMALYITSSAVVIYGIYRLVHWIANRN
jgi:hypothetical protein